MNVLDENIIANQRQRLRSWRIPVRQIGVDKGMIPLEIIPSRAVQPLGALFLVHWQGWRLSVYGPTIA